jgi:hypothetical protein
VLAANTSSELASVQDLRPLTLNAGHRLTNRPLKAPSNHSRFQGIDDCDVGDTMAYCSDALPVLNATDVF